MDIFVNRIEQIYRISDKPHRASSTYPTPWFALIISRFEPWEPSPIRSNIKGMDIKEIPNNR